MSKSPTNNSTNKNRKQKSFELFVAQWWFLKEFVEDLPTPELSKVKTSHIHYPIPPNFQSKSRKSDGIEIPHIFHALRFKEIKLSHPLKF